MSDKPELSRRSFVTKASLGAAAGALAVAGPLGGRAAAAEAATSSKAATPSKKVAHLPEPVVAHLTDLRSGTVHLYTGERGVTVVNHELAQQLARAAGH